MGSNIPTLTIREKTIGNIDMQLYTGDDTIDLSEVDHLQLEMRDKQGKVYSYSTDDETPYISIVTAASGKVRFSPPSNTFFIAARQPYSGYWIVWTAADKNYAVPENFEFIIYVREEF